MKLQSFPLIEKMVLKQYDIQDLAVSFAKGEAMPRYFVSTFDLESALEKATVVYSTKKDFMFDEKAWHEYKYGAQTHTALLINVEEIPKDPLKHEYKTKIESCDGWLQMPQSFKGKSVKITIEEIKE